MSRLTSDLAEVLRLRDRVDEAVATAEQARFLYEQKGSTAAARKLQAWFRGASCAMLSA